jgi:hypothetical protein
MTRFTRRHIHGHAADRISGGFSHALIGCIHNVM